ncbi:DUF2285 domain-containing protein [Bradyrhizobium sp. Arg816]|uniref:DUF2285 domain-containing protein n=1 Tax=Bradyrhizobium sp. Arg816 TaxID=2998491 RepID=UPI00249E49F9|nr:DUF2285 domain-containing protein [Bradyrhizobium sp. Arg816]MDI3563362.1 DUF2285 domain-containing protein [Bradyrhizobium sp. Arg816]
MQKPPLDPDVADSAADDKTLALYDEQHVVTYTRLLQAESEGADWREVARKVLNAYDSHVVRAKWVTEEGRLLRGAGSN